MVKIIAHPSGGLLTYSDDLHDDLAERIAREDAAYHRQQIEAQRQAYAQASQAPQVPPGSSPDNLGNIGASLLGGGLGGIASSQRGLLGLVDRTNSALPDFNVSNPLTYIPGTIKGEAGLASNIGHAVNPLIQGAADAITPKGQSGTQQFLGGLAGGLGNMVVGGPALGFAGSAMDERHKELIDKGIDPNSPTGQKYLNESGLLGGAMGLAFEVLGPLAKGASKFVPEGVSGLNGWLARHGIEAATHGVGGGALMGAQQFGENVVSGQYDPHQDLMQGVGESALVGGAIGAAAHGIHEAGAAGFEHLKNKETAANLKKAQEADAASYQAQQEIQNLAESGQGIGRVLQDGNPITDFNQQVGPPEPTPWEMGNNPVGNPNAPIQGGKKPRVKVKAKAGDNAEPPIVGGQQAGGPEGPEGPEGAAPILSGDIQSLVDGVEPVPDVNQQQSQVPTPTEQPTQQPEEQGLQESAQSTAEQNSQKTVGPSETTPPVSPQGSPLESNEAGSGGAPGFDTPPSPLGGEENAAATSAAIEPNPPNIAGQEPKSQFGVNPADLFSRVQSPPDHIATEVAGRPVAQGDSFSAKSVWDKLRAELNRMGLGDIGLNLHDAMWDEGNPDGLIKGSYSPTSKMIELASKIYDPNLSADQLLGKLRQVMTHESIHALRGMNLFKGSEWNTLAKEAASREKPNSGGKTFFQDAAENYHPLDADGKPRDPSTLSPEEMHEWRQTATEESIANMAAHHAEKYPRVSSQPEGLMNKVLSTLMKVVRAIGRSKADKLIDAVRNGEIGKRDPYRMKSANPRDFASDINSDPKQYMMVYHGTPHAFNKFDLSHVGAGENNKTYGWGAYVAENKDVAKYYVKNLQKYGISNLLHMNMRPHESELLDWDKNIHDDPYIKAKLLTGLKNMEGKAHPKTAGRLKRIRLDIESGKEETGEEIYRSMNRAFMEDPNLERVMGDDQGGYRATSKALDAEGIPGLKFYDGKSREIPDDSGKKKTRNFVLFDEKHLDPVSKIEHPLQSSMIDKLIERNKDNPLFQKFLQNAYTNGEALGSTADVDSKPAVFYHMAKDNRYSNKNGAPDIEKFKTEGSRYGGVSAAVTPEFSNWWGGYYKNTPHEQLPVNTAHYPIMLASKKVGDFRKPADLLKAMRYLFKRKYGSSLDYSALDPEVQKNQRKRLDGLHGILSWILSDHDSNPDGTTKSQDNYMHSKKRDNIDEASNEALNSKSRFKQIYQYAMNPDEYARGNIEENLNKFMNSSGKWNGPPGLEDSNWHDMGFEPETNSSLTSGPAFQDALGQLVDMLKKGIYEENGEGHQLREKINKTIELRKEQQIYSKSAMESHEKNPKKKELKDAADEALEKYRNLRDKLYEDKPDSLLGNSDSKLSNFYDWAESYDKVEEWNDFIDWENENPWKDESSYYKDVPEEPTKLQLETVDHYAQPENREDLKEFRTIRQAKNDYELKSTERKSWEAEQVGNILKKNNEYTQKIADNVKEIEDKFKTHKEYSAPTLKTYAQEQFDKQDSLGQVDGEFEKIVNNIKETIKSKLKNSFDLERRIQEIHQEINSSVDRNAAQKQYKKELARLEKDAASSHEDYLNYGKKLDDPNSYRKAFDKHLEEWRKNNTLKGAMGDGNDAPEDWTLEKMKEFDPQYAEEIAAGDYHHWEDTAHDNALITDNGWDAVHMREATRPESPVNIFIKDPDKIVSPFNSVTWDHGPDPSRKITIAVEKNKEIIKQYNYMAQKIGGEPNQYALTGGAASRLKPSLDGEIILRAASMANAYVNAFGAAGEALEGLPLVGSKSALKLKKFQYGISREDWERGAQRWLMATDDQFTPLYRLVHKIFENGNVKNIDIDNPMLAAAVAPGVAQNRIMEFRRAGGKRIEDTASAIMNADTRLEQLRKHLPGGGVVGEWLRDKNPDGTMNYKVAGKQLMVEAYAYAKHALEYNKYGRDVMKKELPNKKGIDQSVSGMTDNEALAILHFMSSLPKEEYDKILEAHRALMQVTEDTRLERIRTGLEPDYKAQRKSLQAELLKKEALHNSETDPDKKAKLAEQVVNIKNAINKIPDYQHYVPLKSSADHTAYDSNGNPTEGNAEFSGGAKLSIKGAEDYNRTGRSSYAADIMPNVLTGFENTVQRGVRNQAGNALLKMIKDAHAAGDPDISSYFEKPEVIPYHWVKGSDGVVTSKPVVDYTSQPDAFMTKVNGEDVYVKIKNAEMATAINGFSDADTGSMAALTRGLKGLVTGINHFVPLSAWNRLYHFKNAGASVPFAVRLFFKHTDMAKLNAAGFNDPEIAKLIGKHSNYYINALINPMASAADKAAAQADLADLKRRGGIIQPYSMGSFDDVQDHLNAVLSDGKFKDLPQHIQMAKMNEALHKAEKFLVGFTNNVEWTTRLAVDRAFRERGYDPKRAAYMAQDLTGNFSRRGTATQSLAQLYPFYNAGVQSDKSSYQSLLRMGAQGGLKKTGKWIGRLVAIGFMTSMYNDLMGNIHKDSSGNNPYWMMSDADRNGVNGLFNVPFTNYYLKYPKPFKVLSIPQNFGSRLYDMATGHADPWQTAGRTMGEFVGGIDHFGGNPSANPAISWVPGAARLPAQLATNSSWNGQPIHPISMSYPQLPNSQEHKRNSSEGAKNTANFLSRLTGGDGIITPGGIELYPDDIDYMMSQLLGGAGNMVSQAAGVSSLAMPNSRALSGKEPYKVSDLPVVSNVLGRAGADKVNGTYYDESKPYAEMKVRISHLAKEEQAGDPDAAVRLAQIQAEHPDIIGKLPLYEEAENEIKSLRHSIKMVQADNQTPIEQRASLVRQYENTIANYQRQIISRVRDKGYAPQ